MDTDRKGGRRDRNGQDIGPWGCDLGWVDKVVQSRLLSAIEEVLGFWGSVYGLWGAHFESGRWQCKLGAGGGNGRRAQRKEGNNELG